MLKNYPENMKSPTVTATIIIVMALLISFIIFFNESKDINRTENFSQFNQQEKISDSFSVSPPSKDSPINPDSIVLGEKIRLKVDKQPPPIEEPFDATEFIYLVSEECLVRGCANKISVSPRSWLWPEGIELKRFVNFQDSIDVEIDTSEIGIISEGKYYIEFRTFFGPRTNTTNLEKMDHISTSLPITIRHPDKFSDEYPLANQFGDKTGGFTLKGVRFTESGLEDILDIYFEGEVVVDGRLEFSEFFGNWLFIVDKSFLEDMPFNGSYVLRETPRKPITTLNIFGEIKGMTDEDFEIYGGDKFPYKPINVTAKIRNIRQVRIGYPAGGAGTPFTEELEVLHVHSQ